MLAGISRKLAVYTGGSFSKNISPKQDRTDSNRACECIHEVLAHKFDAVTSTHNPEENRRIEIGKNDPTEKLQRTRSEMPAMVSRITAR